MPINVVVVDDSAVIRGLMTKALSADSEIVIAGTAANGVMAVSMAKSTQPDIILLDIEMPVMDGLTALPELLKVSPGSRVIMASTLTLRNAEISMKAMSLGAVDYLAKPSAKMGQEVDLFYRELINKVKALGKARPPVVVPVAVAPAEPIAKAPAASNGAMHLDPDAIHRMLQPVSSDHVPLHQLGIKALAIASSTGGPQALIALFNQLNGHLMKMPIFITQHMPPNFTTILADHISKASGRPCLEAKGGEVVAPGNIYLAPGDFHMVPEKNDVGVVTIRTNQEPPENFCRPAADPMLRALSKIYDKHLAVVVLTGMGQDGMEGARVVVEHGGNVIAQDEATCVVYGMPKAVVDAKLARAVLPLPEMGGYLISQIEGH